MQKPREKNCHRWRPHFDMHLQVGKHEFQTKNSNSSRLECNANAYIKHWSTGSSPLYKTLLAALEI